MKRLKKILFLCTFLFIMPLFVQAGSIRFNTPEKVSATSYKFTLTVQDMELNHISGKISISNGTISNIVMSSGWMNKTGNNNTFYFYRNGVSVGDYTVATIYVTMTGNSRYSVSDVDYGTLKCTKDIYGTYFGDKGNVVNESTYLSVCGKSKDATLKSLSLSNGSLSPSFSPSLEIYSATVENGVNAISIFATPNYSKAKIISGTHCTLNIGLNTCKVVVQAEAGNTKTYSITVVRKGNSGGVQPSSDASIRDLKVHNGTLVSSFSSSKTEYDVKVSKTTTEIYFTFVMVSNGQSMKSDVCRITPDTSKCKLTITAEDGVSTKQYAFRILHEGKEENDNVNSSGTEEKTENIKPILPSSNTGNTNNNNNNSNNNSSSNENINSSNNSSSNVEEENKEENDSNLLEQEEHYYTENPKEDNTVFLPIIDKEVSATLFYSILTIVIVFSGIGLGFVLACILKKIVRKR